MQLVLALVAIRAVDVLMWRVSIIEVEHLDALQVALGEAIESCQAATYSSEAPACVVVGGVVGEVEGFEEHKQLTVNS